MWMVLFLGSSEINRMAKIFTFESYHAIVNIGISAQSSKLVRKLVRDQNSKSQKFSKINAFKAKEIEK